LTATVTATVYNINCQSSTSAQRPIASAAWRKALGITEEHTSMGSDAIWSTSAAQTPDLDPRSPHLEDSAIKINIVPRKGQ
jgi:hypothetical protein